METATLGESIRSSGRIVGAVRRIAAVPTPELVLELMVPLGIGPCRWAILAAVKNNTAVDYGESIGGAMGSVDYDISAGYLMDPCVFWWT